ncbi:MAG: acylneuraminate cytidylyltransferase family protein [Candidatus Micrarchaeota archaeon]
MKVLALILARGGSERIPKKNIAMLGGHPLIHYTIEAAKKSKHINRIIVSTDSQEIADVAKRLGAEVPFLRPAEISKSDSTELQAFEHALGYLKDEEGYEPDIIVKPFPTSPFRTTKTIDRAIEMLIAHPEADSVRSVRLCKEHPYKMWRIEGGELKHLIPEDQKPDQAHTLSYQVLPEVYVNNASIDVTKPSTVFGKKSITGSKILALVMDELESHDINTPLDLLLAERLLKGRR